jgi:nucleoside-diphosphate-sugar epimerase
LFFASSGEVANIGRVLVTGASGFLGRALVGVLLASGERVRALTRRPAEVHPDAEPWVADLGSADRLEAAFDGVDVLVHLAATLSGPPEKLERDNVEGTRRLLEAMARTLTRRVVLASSLAVYDWSSVDGVLSEACRTLEGCTRAAEAGAYARTKMAQERLTRELARAHGWTLTVLRTAALWNDGSWADFMLGKRWRTIQTVVAPRAPARLVRLERAVDAFARAAQRAHGGELIVNLVDDATVSNWQYARLVQKQRGGILVPVPYRLGLLAARLAAKRTRVFEALHKPALCANAQAREKLGWKPWS